MIHLPDEGSGKKSPHGGFFLAGGYFFDDLIGWAATSPGEEYVLYIPMKADIDGPYDIVVEEPGYFTFKDKDLSPVGFVDDDYVWKP